MPLRLGKASARAKHRLQGSQHSPCSEVSLLSASTQTGFIPSLVASQQHPNIPHPLLLGCSCDGDEGKRLLQQPLPAKLPEHHLGHRGGDQRPTVSPGSAQRHGIRENKRGPREASVARESKTPQPSCLAAKGPEPSFFFCHFPDVSAVSRFKAQLIRALCPSPQRACAGQRVADGRVPHGCPLPPPTLGCSAVTTQRETGAGSQAGSGPSGRGSQLCYPAIAKYQGAH